MSEKERAMSDIDLPPEAVEAGARAAFEFAESQFTRPKTWDELHPRVREAWLGSARITLTAAGPIIAAEVERLDEALAREVRGRNYAMRQRDDWQRAARGNIDALNTAIRERDEARQQVADLRAGIEALATEGEAWGRGVAVDLSKRLRALLAGSGEQAVRTRIARGEGS